MVAGDASVQVKKIGRLRKRATAAGLQAGTCSGKLKSACEGAPSRRGTTQFAAQSAGSRDGAARISVFAHSFALPLSPVGADCAVAPDGPPTPPPGVRTPHFLPMDGKHRVRSALRCFASVAF